MNEDKVYTFTIIEKRDGIYDIECKALNMRIYGIMTHTLPSLMKVIATDYCALFEFEV